MSSPAPGAAAKSKGFGGHGLILTGLMLGVLLAALDQTVVGTSLPKIVADLHDFEHFSALITGYLLASTIVIPMAGKFSDLYGRRPVYLTGMIVFLAGSALCGLAGEFGDWHLGGWTVTGMNQLIFFRFLQGLGGGAIFPVAIATIADLYSPAERGRVQGLFGAVFGLSSVIGPFIGGWIVDYVHIADIASWRWVFYVNLPVGAVAIAMVATHFPKKTVGKDIKIDWLGIASIMAGITAIILMATWGGADYAWGSPQILGLVAFTLAMAALFIFAESRAADPIIPLHLWKEPIFTVSILAVVLMGAAMFGVISFMPTYMQGVVGISATYSGAVMVPLSLSLVAASIISGRMMTRFGYKPFTISGALIASSAFVGLWYVSEHGVPPVWLAILIMIWLGLGLGFTIQTFIVAVQNAVEKRFVGTATASVTLFRTLGATVGIAAFGSLLNRHFTVQLPAKIGDAGVNALLADPNVGPFLGGRVQNIPTLLVKPEFTANAPPALVQGIKDAFSLSIAWVWLAGAIVALVAFVVAIFLKQRALKTAEEYHGEKPAPSAMH